MATSTNNDVMKKIGKLYEETFAHDGNGNISIDIRILRRGQKEVIIHCGKQHRFIVDYANDRQAGRSAE